MKNILLILFLIGNFLTCFTQDNFANALLTLDAELGFKPTADTYTIGKKLNERLLHQFKECAKFDQLEKLNKLNFDHIIKVKSAELLTSKWEGKWQIEFKEWHFKNTEYASKFIDILDSLSPSRVQFCVNKGGMMWWRAESKIYVVTSRAYFVTYHYKEIKKAIIDGLNT